MAIDRLLRFWACGLALPLWLFVSDARAADEPEKEPATEATAQPQAKQPADENAEAEKHLVELSIEDGKYRCRIDTSDAKQLSDWARDELAPVVEEWYPKIVEMLPSDDYKAPESFTIVFSNETGGVAATAGTNVFCNGKWFEGQLKGEAKGAIVHELVHVVQQYGRARRANRNGPRARSPGWLVEGVADYIRWFLYEPGSRGAEIGRRGLRTARHDGSYRVSANFLNYVTESHDRDIVKKLNAAMREGRYQEDLWKDSTGKSLDDLAADWKADLEKKLEQPAEGQGN